ncbi:MAG: GIY-YIG nuclease family protein [Candidatus Krumholzibacteria bacterium]|nr:GIY-YIG nuclease family protein [Candidatus Krumholzibacteria bacterium]
MKRHLDNTPSGEWAKGGAYVLVLNIKRSLRLSIGALGEFLLKRGTYLYIGNARKGIGGRVRRHIRLSHRKGGPEHWHIDTVLNNPFVELEDALAFPGTDECTISKALARRAGVEAPVPGFGASDCRMGCSAHLYRLGPGFQGRISSLASIIADMLSAE